MSDNNSKKDKTIAGILAIFGGSFGVHQFYLGNIGMGILYLMTFLLSWVFSWIDAIKLFTMSQDRFDRKYNPQFFMRTDAKPTHSLPANVNVADEINKLDVLFKRGVLTFEEFEKRKAQLLD